MKLHIDLMHRQIQFFSAFNFELDTHQNQCTVKISDHTTAHISIKQKIKILVKTKYLF